MTQVVSFECYRWYHLSDIIIYRIFKQKEDCTPTAWRERQQKESDSREA